MFLFDSDSAKTTLSSEVDLTPLNREYLTPSEFLEAVDRVPDQIHNASFVAPRLGDDHFGYFEVEYETPVYK
jgi:hypothetical protein